MNKSIRTIEESVEELRKKNTDFMEKAMLIVHALRIRDYPMAFTKDFKKDMRQALHNLVEELKK